MSDHHKQLLYYVAKLDLYIMVLGDRWLQTHNSAINWRDYTIKFNLISCIESGCFLRDILCIKFAIGNKVKDKIRAKKFTAVDNNIEIKPVNAKHFFQIAYQKDHEGYM